MPTDTFQPFEEALVYSGAAPQDVLERLYGAAMPESGVLHVAAVTDVSGTRRVLEIRAETPKSSVDCYVLNATRAWADVVLTSGRIVRAEPDLSFAVDAPSAEAATALRAARGDRPAVTVAVLTSGIGLHGEMPVWRAGGTPVVFTDERGVQRLEWAVDGGVEVVVEECPSPRSMVAWARQRFGVDSRISVELGPSTSAALYAAADRDSLVETLLLSQYLPPVGSPLPESLVGAPFLPGVDLAGAFDRRGCSTVGAWTFSRWDAR